MLKKMLRTRFHSYTCQYELSPLIIWTIAVAVDEGDQRSHKRMPKEKAPGLESEGVAVNSLGRETCTLFP